MEATTTTYHIGIDANEANVQHRVGSNVYAYEIIRHLELITRNKPEHIWTVFLTELPIVDMPAERAGWKYVRVQPAKFATQWALPKLLFSMRKELDLFYTPGHYAPRFCPVPYITSVMDLAFVHYPKQFKLKDLLQLKMWTQYSVKGAKKIVTISQSSKADIQKVYKIPENRIEVIYPSGQVEVPKSFPANTIQSFFHKHRITAPYLLYVGTLQPRKNLVRMISAFEKLVLKQESELQKVSGNVKRKRTKKSKSSIIQLVIAGKTGWLAAPILERIANSPNKKDIIVTGFVSEEEKAMLYRFARGTLLVGLYEGFGMPALESLHHKVVPIVSNISSLPEVVGHAGILVDPMSETQIMRGMDKALNMNKRQIKAFHAAAKNQIEQFSWLKSTEKLLETFHSVL